jgi:hypothetical protein
MELKGSSPTYIPYTYIYLTQNFKVATPIVIGEVDQSREEITVFANIANNYDLTPVFQWLFNF